MIQRELFQSHLQKYISIGPIFSVNRQKIDRARKSRTLLARF